MTIEKKIDKFKEDTEEIGKEITEIYIQEQ